MRPRLAWTLAACGALALIYHAYGQGVSEALQKSVGVISGWGLWGFLLFFCLYIVSSLAFFPASAMTLAAGAVWGVGAGFLLVWASASAAAATAFWAGRYFAREWVAKKLAGNQSFEAVDRAVAREGVKIVILTRLSPVFPFVLLNYAYGLTRIGFWGYLWATVFGMLPGTLAYVYLGALAGDAARAGTGESVPAWLWGLRIAGFAATAAVAWLAAKIARQALARKM